MDIIILQSILPWIIIIRARATNYQSQNQGSVNSYEKCHLQQNVHITCISKQHCFQSILHKVAAVFPVLHLGMPQHIGQWRLHI